jgi:hypothetical protein
MYLAFSFYFCKGNPKEEKNPNIILPKKKKKKTPPIHTPAPIPPVPPLKGKVPLPPIPKSSR